MKEFRHLRVKLNTKNRHVGCFNLHVFKKLKMIKVTDAVWEYK